MKILKRNKSVIENIIIPAILFILSFYDFNRGVDLTDAGYSLSGFFYFDKMPGISGIPMFWSYALGFLFTRLPYGDTWTGCLFYCTFVIAGSVMAAYFFWKKYMDYRIVAIAEIFAIIYCWNPNSVLYDYLSFLLFELAMIILLKGIETEENKFYIIAGMILGVNTFVRIPNAAEVAAIVLVWFAGWYRKRKISQIAGQTGACAAGYFGGLFLSLGIILTVYDGSALAAAVEELILESSVNEDYGIMYMLLQTVKVVCSYSKYVLYFIAVIIVGSIVLFAFERFRKENGRWQKYLRVITAVTVFIFTVISYYRFAANNNLFDDNWFDFTSIIGLCCIYLFWGIVVSIINLFVVPDLRTKLFALLFLGMFYVIPLGSNNHIYLVIMDMFMLIPLVVYHSVCLERHVNSANFSIPYRSVLYGSFLVMLLQSCQFGINYIFHDDNVSITVEDENALKGMRTNGEKAGIIRHMTAYCEENNLTGEETIFYCNGPGLAFTLKLEPVLSSTWIDWYTNPAVQFEKEIQVLREEGKTPLIILSPRYSCYYEQDWMELEEMGLDKAYMETDVKYLILWEYMQENDYKKCYENDWYIMYKCE